MMKTPTTNKIIIALDVEDLLHAGELVKCLKDDVGAFKIGKQLFTRYGPEAIDMVHKCEDLQRVGRPVTQAPEPAAIAKEIRAELEA